MSKALRSRAVFKTHGDWTTSDARQWAKSHPAFVNENTDDAYWGGYPIAVGGTLEGSSPAITADVVYWLDNNECAPCDANLCRASVRLASHKSRLELLTGFGKAILKASIDREFSTGFYVAIEAVPLYVALETLSDEYWEYYQGIYQYKRPGYANGRRYSKVPYSHVISESDGYITTLWPSGMTADFRYADNVGLSWSRFGGTYLIGVGNQYTSGSVPRLCFVKYVVESGTFSGNALSPTSSQIIPNIGSLVELWLGIAEGYARAGVNSAIFLEKLAMSPLDVREWATAHKYYRVQTAPTASATMFSEDAYYNILARNSCGLSFIEASVHDIESWNVTASPKSVSRRGSLVKSASDLIWSTGNRVMYGSNYGFFETSDFGTYLSGPGAGDFVHAGVTAEQTTKAALIKTSWPFEQPDQSSALSVGGAASQGRTLTVAMQCDVVVTPTYGSLPSDQGTKPPVTLSAYPTVAQSGKIGVDAQQGLNVGQTYTVRRDHPSSDAWANAFAWELSHLESAGQHQSNGYGAWIGEWESIYLDPGAQLAKNWSVSAADTYTMSYPPITWDGFPQYFFVDSVSCTNALPNGGGQTCRDAFIGSVSGGTAVDAYIANTASPFEEIQAFATGIPSVVKTGEVEGHKYATVGMPARYEGHRETFAFNNASMLSGWSVVSSTKTNDLGKRATQVTVSKQNIYTKLAIVPTGSLPPPPSGDSWKPSIDDLNDTLSMYCNASRLYQISSCQWIPKVTQVFCCLERGAAGFVPPNTSTEWPYVGGNTPQQDVVDVTDYDDNGERFCANPSGGTLHLFVRKTWQIVSCVASGPATLTPASIVSETITQPTINQYAQDVFEWKCLRTAEFEIEFDPNAAPDQKTHTFSHEQVFSRSFALSEQQMHSLEEGESVSVSLPLSLGLWFSGNYSTAAANVEISVSLS